MIVAQKWRCELPTRTYPPNMFCILPIVYYTCRTVVVFYLSFIVSFEDFFVRSQFKFGNARRLLRVQLRVEGLKGLKQALDCVAETEG